jgi:hypothetical protein
MSGASSRQRIFRADAGDKDGVMRAQRQLMESRYNRSDRRQRE